LFASPVAAVTIETKLPDPSQEMIAEEVISQLACVVCEGQALTESDATFAREMRAEIRRMAAEGQSEDAIIGFFRERYGNKILLNPPVEQSTMLLWFGPLLFVLFGGLIIRRIFRREKA
jgi:cytochrome c-type biogenesis protein CcmH